MFLDRYGGSDSPIACTDTPSRLFMYLYLHIIHIRNAYLSLPGKPGLFVVKLKCAAGPDLRRPGYECFDPPNADITFLLAEVSDVGGALALSTNDLKRA